MKIMFLQWNLDWWKNFLWTRSWKDRWK